REDICEKKKRKTRNAVYNRFGNSPSEQKPDEYSLGVQVEYLNHVPEHYQPEILPCARHH
ncbi:hypothetical protein NE548_09645, partial [Lactobacillus gasseri]|nr:hypothetical protein [Lactobacillus gasseri]